MTPQEWRKAFPDRMRAARRRWVEENREHVREYQREYKRRYRYRKAIEAFKKEEAQNGNLRTDQAGE